MGYGCRCSGQGDLNVNTMEMDLCVYVSAFIRQWGTNHNFPIKTGSVTHM